MVREHEPSVLVVSGLPRSGTSLAMALLKAGGLPIFSDGMRRADSDNPRGYYEYAGAARLKTDNRWVHKAVGKGVKVISPLLQFLPSDLCYRIVFMRRNLHEISLSQEKMLQRRGHEGGDSEQMKGVMQAHLDQIGTWLAKQRHMSVCYLDYRWVVENPVVASHQLAQFAELKGEPSDMALVVEERLYRQRIESGR